MRTRIAPKNQVVLTTKRGKYLPRPNTGVVAWLLDCPEKGFFVPIPLEATGWLRRSSSLIRRRAAR